MEKGPATFHVDTHQYLQSHMEVSQNVGVNTWIIWALGNPTLKYMPHGDILSQSIARLTSEDPWIRVFADELTRMGAEKRVHQNCPLLNYHAIIIEHCHF